MKVTIDELCNGINYGLCAIALVCLVAAIWQFVRNRRLQELIKDFRKQVRQEHDSYSEQGGKQEHRIETYIAPVELLDLLQVDQEEVFSLDKVKSVHAVSMSINDKEFSNLIHQMSAKEVFSFINRFLSQSIPQVYQYGGFVEKFQNAGIQVRFLDAFGEAVDLAVSLCDLLDELGKQNPHYKRFTIGITYEQAVVGMVGATRRWMPVTLSAESSNLSQWLQELAEKYYARILVTDAYAQLIPDFRKKFHVRMLGYVYLKDTDQLKRIYDVYDGDDMEVRNRKRQTRMVFEKGVRLFTERNYVDARQYFIEVLKTDRYDRAAKEYVYRCEDYIKNPQVQKISIESYG